MTKTTSHDQATARLSELSDIDRLWQAEFGKTVELWLRIAAIALTGAGLWLYDGSLLGPVWALTYLSLLSVCAIALLSGKSGKTSAWVAALGCHGALTLSFVALPVFLTSSSDPVLLFWGIMALVAFGLFTLHREEPPAFIQPLDIAIIWVAILVAWLTHVPDATGWIGKALVTVACLFAGGYYTSALISVRASAAEVRRAAREQQAAHTMQAIGHLSGGIAHDFNNILTALQGSLELYHEVPPGAEREALVDEARQASARASALVAKLLAFGRRAPLAPQPLDASHVVQEIAELAQSILPVGMRLETRHPGGAVQVLADPAGLKSALTNLLLNAREAVDAQGTITIAVDLAHGPACDGCAASTDDPSDAHLCFSVADDGPGMDTAVLARAFEPFFSTKGVGRGSGMGLCTALGFAQQSCGSLKIKTSEAGTTVALHLPIAPDTDSPRYGIGAA